MITRDICTELIQAATEYPVVTIVGPRQSGKSTLVQSSFPKKPYYSMEDPDVRAAAEYDPVGFLSNIKNGAILDEIQRLPTLLSYLQGIVDEDSRVGRFILTGSRQPLLHEAISQSLAGRTAVLTLWPFSLHELRNYSPSFDPFDLMVQGCFPRVHENQLLPRRFFNSYLQTYVERDVRSLIQVRDLSQFQKFMTLLAARTGQIVNFTAISNDCGVSTTTIRHWLSALSASYVVFELQPYSENIRKRVVRSPKVYFTDVGLATFLLGITTRDQATHDPLRGNLYENLVIADIMKEIFNRGLRPELYFFRDSRGNEVDLLIKDGRRLMPIEIKSAATFTPDWLKGLDYIHSLGLTHLERGVVLYNGAKSFNLNGTRIFNPIQCASLWNTLWEAT